MKIIIDLENTLSNSSHRMKHLESSDQVRFQEEFKNDTLNENVKLFMDMWRKNGYDIVILSAKKDIYLKMVVDWLVKYDVIFTELIMKPATKNGVSDINFKEAYVYQNSQDIMFALDDVGANCKMFAKYNIPCLRVEQK